MKALLSNQRGWALVLTMVVLLVLAILVTTVTTMTTTELRIAGNQKRYIQALNVAEAGINEVIQRMKLPWDDSLALVDTAYPLRTGWQTVILLGSSVPPAVGDTVYTRSVQVGGMPTSDWLHYSTATGGDDALKVRHKTSPAGDSIYYFNTRTRTQFMDAPDYNGVFYPVEIVEVTGQQGNAKRKVIAALSRAPMWPLITGALVSGVKVKATGTVDFCGHNHVRNTPAGTKADTLAGGCFAGNWHISRADGNPHPAPCGAEDINCTAVGCIPGILTIGDSITISGDAKNFGNPDSASDSTNPFYEIWEVLGYDTEAEMNALITWKTETNPVNGFTQYTGSHLKLTGNQVGRGVLWVRGDLSISGTVDFAGIIYVDGDFKLTGNVWILGSVIVKGVTEIKLTTGTGTATILYSSRAIQDVIQQSLGAFSILSWREL